jgi:hypothetical protein
MRWEVHVTYMRKMRNAYRISLEIPGGKKLLGGLRR